MHALIIEDESLIAMAIEDVLRDCGFTSFEFAVSDEAAVLAAARKCPDLITADVNLSPGCGIETIQTICSKAAVPVLFITGSAVEVTSRMPAHPMVQKPFNAEDLKQAIRQTLTGWALSPVNGQIDKGQGV